MGTLVIHLLDILYLSSMSIIVSIITRPPFFFSMLLCDFLMYTLHISPSALCHYVLVLFPLCWFYFSFRFFECCQSTFTPFCCHITFLDPPESLLWALYVSLCCRSFLWGYTGWVLDSKGRLSLQVSPFSFFSLEITVVFLGLSTPLLALHH